MAIIPLGFYKSRNVNTNGLVFNIDASNTNSYPRTGSTWIDLTSSLYSGTLTGSPTFSYNNGGYFSFNGTTDYVNYGDILDLGTNDLTSNAWIRITSSWATGNRILAGKSITAGQNFRYLTLSFNSSRNLRGFMQGNGGSDVTPFGNTILDLNVWYMVTSVFKRNSSIELYVNGNQETITGSAVISQWAGLDFQSVNPFRIGSTTTGDNSTPTNFFPGDIASVQMYFRALTINEIKENFNATRTKFGI
jgi:hypothetical protein